MPTPTTNQKKINITIKRTGARVALFLKLPTEMETFYKNMSENGSEQESAVWRISETAGAMFYSESPNSEKITAQLAKNYSVYSNFGGGLIDKSGRINLAPLRTVGASAEEGISIYSDRFDETNLVDFESYIRQLAGVAKKLWTDYVADTEIKANITFEV